MIRTVWVCFQLLFTAILFFVCGSRADSILVTELCVDFCDGRDCRSYQTPLSDCYSGQSLFPNDPSWGDVDFMDEIVNGMLERTIFGTNDGTCSDETDNFTLPLNQCVGPFGKPRPWGQFSLGKSE